MNNISTKTGKLFDALYSKLSERLPEVNDGSSTSYSMNNLNQYTAVADAGIKLKRLCLQVQS